MARRRPPPTAARRPPPGRRPPPRDEDEFDDELPPQPPLWERIILSKSFRLVVFSTCAAAAIALVVFWLGPGNITRGLGIVGSVVARQTGRLGGLASSAIASSIQDEGRRLWIHTATPLPTATPTNTPLPTATPFPTPPPPRRVPTTAPPAPIQGMQPGQPAQRPTPMQLPIDAALSSMREYFEIVSSGDVRRALQYWAPATAPEARSLLDAAVARGEKYHVNNITANQLPDSTAVEIIAQVEVTDSSGATTSVEQRYQWRFIDNQWYITSRLQ